MLCKSSLDTQEHALHCQSIPKHLTTERKELLSAVEYEDIFRDTHKQLRITKVYQSIIQTREKLQASFLDTAYPG